MYDHVQSGFQVKVVTPVNYTTSESGLIYRDFAVGEGDCPQAGQQVFLSFFIDLWFSFRKLC